ncbi:MAG: T9SS type A sorting domain-containing protein [Bacteroidetes bacterium]|nr:T9SS type A sorting domain-containing protein [Bacteroidota bacterium]
MKKFYLAVSLFLSGFFCVNVAYAQPPYTAAETYETVAAGGILSDVNTWVGLKQPNLATACTHCQIILHGDVTLDVKAYLNGGSTVILTGNSGANPTVLHLDYWAILDAGSTLSMFQNAVLYVDDELDLTQGSTISMVSSAFADATGFTSVHVPVGPLTPAFGPGIYYLINPPSYAIGTWDMVLNLNGYGDPTVGPPVTPPGAGTDRFFDPYIINCTPGPSPAQCASGVVYGPATSGFDAVHNIFSFAQGSTLPVTLTQFAASRNDDGTVKLIWSTSEEENASHFEVERSADVSSGFASIGTVKAKGFSSIATDYSYNDLSAPTGTVYYRLKMVDLDGKFQYTKVISVSGDSKSDALVVYNNPFTDMIRIKVNTNSVDDLSLTVTDMLGKVYWNQSIKAKSGDNFININPGGAAGVYMLHIEGRGYDRIVKLVKQ